MPRLPEQDTEDISITAVLATVLLVEVPGRNKARVQNRVNACIHRKEFGQRQGIGATYQRSVSKINGVFGEDYGISRKNDVLVSRRKLGMDGTIMPASWVDSGTVLISFQSGS